MISSVAAGFPGQTEIEFAFCDGDNDFPADGLALEVGVGVVLLATLFGVRRCDCVATTLAHLCFRCRGLIQRTAIAKQ